MVNAPWTYKGSLEAEQTTCILLKSCADVPLRYMVLQFLKYKCYDKAHVSGNFGGGGVGAVAWVPTKICGKCKQNLLKKSKLDEQKLKSDKSV